MPSHPDKFSNTWYGKVNKQIILYIFSKIYIYIYIYINCTVTKFDMYSYNSKQECKDNSKQMHKN